MQKGVAPISLRLVKPNAIFFVIRALRFAPFATSFLINSTLVMLPDPSGAGSLSPPLGFRTEGIACSTVYPGPLAFGSAPESSSIDASS